MPGEPVAIVGMGCVLPDARAPEAFWENLVAGRCSVRPLAGGLWDWSRYYDETGADPDRAFSILGARVSNFEPDWRTLKIPPADVQAVNPMQFMVLDAGIQALGAIKVIPRERTGLFIGSTGLGWQHDTGLRLHLQRAVEAIERSPTFARLPKDKRDRVLAEMKRTLDARLKPVSEDNVVGAAASVAAGRIAMHFDLKGLHYGVDAGFASSLAAVDVGLRALRDGTLDMAVVGGASELLTPLELVAFSRLGGMSRQRVTPFDARADGTLLGEGAVLFALKRLDDAQRDGDPIRAVILGAGGSSDGKGRSAVAPRAEGQAIAMRCALDDAGVDAASLSFIECHATGTQVGDASEVRALASVYGGGPRNTIALGSAKAFVGHLRAGAGAVGMMRAVLALEHQLVPKQIGVEAINPSLELDRSPFFVPIDAAAALLPGAETRAAVSAFGFGGNNYHVILQAGAPRTARPKRAIFSGDIAICAMGGRFPIGSDVPSFWNGLLEGKDATREVPRERWDIDRHFDPDPTRLDTTYTRLGCFLDALPMPTTAMGIPPSAHESLDPSQVLALLAAQEALAQVDPRAWAADRVGVYLAFLPYQGKKFLADMRVGFAEYGADLALALAKENADPGQIVSEAAANFREGLPAITEDTLTGYLGSMTAARITRMLDVHGPHFVVDSACASTHAALHASVTALRHGVVDAAISGGVWCDMMPEFFVAACRFNALSATGSTPFDQSADGFIPGEGAGCFVLRRLEDAERAGEPILAVLRAVAGSSDGRGRSVLAPRVEGEASAMRRACEAGGVEPASVDYVECHGTGTALGDATEVQAMTAAYGSVRGKRERALLIGSVKSNIGHLNAAAGVPSLVKVTLAVKEGRIPASLKVQVPNPNIDFAAGPVEVVRETRSWVAPPGQPRRAGVSGFGVGGSNMHLIVEQYLPRPGARAATTSSSTTSAATSGPAWPIASAAGTDIGACVAALRAMLRAGRIAQAPDAVASACRVAIVAHDLNDLERRVQRLEAQIAGGAAALEPLRALGIFVGTGADDAKLAVMFPGQGTQYPNMMRSAAARFPVIARTLEEADAAYLALCGRRITGEMFTEQPDAWSQRDEDIHCAVLVVGVALYRQLEALGLRADAVIGQSAGELAALVASGSLPLSEALGALRARTLAVLGVEVADRGQMLSLRCGADDARRLMQGIAGTLVVAADNCPTSCLVSGDTAATHALMAACQAAGIEANALAVSHAYHSSIIAAATAPYRAHLDTVRFSPLNVPLYSTITGERFAAGDLGLAAKLPAHLASQYTSPVLLRGAIESMYQDGVRTFVECGPRWPLTIFADETLGARPHAAIATLHPKVGEVEQLARAVAALWARGRVRIGAPRAADAAPLFSSTAPIVAVAETLQTVVASDPASPALRKLLRSMRDAIDGYLADLELAGAPPAAALAATALASRAQPMAASAPHTTPSVVSPPAAPRGVPDRFAPVQALLIEKAAARTGYPAQMLELDLDLEADLGIDTVKQVAIIAEVKQHLSLPRDPDFKLRDHNTLRKVVGYLTAKLDTREPSGAVAATPTLSSRTHESAHEVEAVLLENAAARTGYPKDMLELDLDLEADLGIDTVKQVAIIAATKQHFGLERDPEFKLRDHNTLGKVARYLVGKLSPGADPPSLVPSSAAPVTEKIVLKDVVPARGPFPQHPRTPPRPVSKAALRAAAASASHDDPGGPPPPRDVTSDVAQRLIKTAAARTGYPADMLELDLDLEADLGIDTVKQVAIIADVKQQLGLPADPSFKLRDHNTLRKIAAHLARVHAAPPPSGERPAPPPALVSTTSSATPARGVRAPSSTEAARAIAPEEKPADSPAPTLVHGPVDLDDRRAGGEDTTNEARLLELVVDGARRAGAIGRLTRLRNVDISAGARAVGVCVYAATSEETTRLRIQRPDGTALLTGEAHISPRPHDQPTPPARETLVAVETLTGVSSTRLAELSAVAASFENLVEVLVVRGLAFDEVVARVRLREDGVVGTDAPTVSALLTAIFVVGAAQASSVSGRVHRLAGIARGQFERVARVGEELVVHARIAGTASAPFVDAEVIDERDRLVARVEGMRLMDVADLEQGRWQRLRNALRRFP